MPPLRRLGPDDDMAPILALLTRAFAYMDGRIDPPSSLRLLNAESLAETAAKAEVWIKAGGPPGAAPRACMVLTPKPDTLYLGKLAVADTARGQGLARVMSEHALVRAAALGLPSVTLETRIELTENQRVFTRLGFAEIARTAHPGYSRPTSITFRKPARTGKEGALPPRPCGPHPQDI